MPKEGEIRVWRRWHNGRSANNGAVDPMKSESVAEKFMMAWRGIFEMLNYPYTCGIEQYDSGVGWITIKQL